MPIPHTDTPPRADSSSSLGSVVVDDIRRTRVRRRDLHELYEFYIDEERRARLDRMNRVQRGFWLTVWLVKSLYNKLPQARRGLLVAALVCFSIGGASWTFGERFQVQIDFKIPAFLILLFILMLELRDKLLAHDELAVGRQVQLALLPREAPAIPGWRIWLYTRPANDVGGDLVDALALDDGTHALALADVAGKGLGAALLMSKLQATVRALAPDARSMADLGARLNTILLRDGLPNRFATMVYLELAPHGDRVRLLNAGHLPPVLLTKHGATRLEPAALPLGMWPDAEFRGQEVAIAPGEMLLVYSDGLSEARNERGDMFGEVALERLLAVNDRPPAPVYGAGLLQQVARFVGDEPYQDDLSIVLIERLDGETPIEPRDGDLGP